MVKMSKYVNHKNGLVIGSDNIFFCIDGEGEDKVIRDNYRAIVWAKDYTFKQFNTANVFIQTPAQQLLWKRSWKSKEAEFNGVVFDNGNNIYTLKPFAKYWLENNVGAYQDKWDVRSEAQNDTDCIFFKRRKDALAFVNHINNTLSGIKISEF